MTLTIGSLFSGVGGLELGLEAALTDAGHDVSTAWQVEIEDYPRAVLAKHWPHTDRRIRDVRLAHRTYATPAGEAFVAGALRRVDLVCGGFPCQDLSTAGRGAGLAGERSGLWWQYWRIVRDLRPRIVVVENVGALLVRGLDTVLGSLAELGYDAEWGVFSAADVGAPHLRRRLAIVAHLPDADGAGWHESESLTGRSRAAVARDDGAAGTVEHAGEGGCPLAGWRWPGGRGRAFGDGADVAHTDAHRREGLEACGAGAREPRGRDADGRHEDVADAGEARRDAHELPGECGAAHALPCVSRSGFRRWAWQRGPSEPRVGGAPDGPPSRLDVAAWEAGTPRTAPTDPTTTPRLAALGNAVVPQWAYVVGQRVAELATAASPTLRLPLPR